MTTRRGAALRRRPLVATPRRRDEDGFTLIELVVIVLVVGALVLIAVPSLLGARQTAQDRSAQADLRHAVEAANTAYIDTADFGQLTAGVLTGVEPGLRFSDLPVSNPHFIAVTTGTCANDSACVALAEPAGDGNCWYVVQSNDSVPLYGKSSASSAGACDPADTQNITLAQDFPS
jgi:type IV pilus assembly protein PilA